MGYLATNLNTQALGKFTPTRPLRFPSLYPAQQKPNQETGIKLHAATGKVSTQSQSDKTSITADKTITVASINKTVMIAAQKHVLLTAMGAFLKLEGGNITIAAPGKVEFKASMKELAGAAKSSPVLPLMPQAETIAAPKEKFSGRLAAVELFSNTKEAPGTPYVMKRQDGSIYQGTLDQHGRTQRLFTEKPEDVTVLVGDGEWESLELPEYD